MTLTASLPPLAGEAAEDAAEQRVSPRRLRVRAAIL
jgi:hypothetical protein